MKRFRGHIGKVEKAMGALLVVTGVLFVTGQITTIAFWMLSMFPGLAPARLSCRRISRDFAA